jgi:hypothetical protein
MTAVSSSGCPYPHTKVSIGPPPNGDYNHPTRLDHFVFLRKKK